VAPSTTTSKPGRYLIILAVIIIAMLAGILRGNIANPSKWHDSFKVGLGLDLSSGTTITLQAVTKNHSTPNQGQMTEAKNIMLQRVDGAGFSGALVQQQGTQFLTVSVPGKGAEQVANLVGQTALLRFRQVLLCSGISTQCLATSSKATNPTASTSPSPSTSGGSSSPSPTTSPSSSTSSSAKASSSSSKGAGKGQAVGATRLGASSSPKASTSAKASSSASTSPSPSPTASTSAPASEVTGDASMVNKQTLALFNKLNCNDKNWQNKIYGSTGAFDNLGSQIVACGTGTGAGVKYVLGPAAVTGTQLTTINAALNSQNNQWQVNFSLNSQGSKAMATLTSNLFNKYYSSTSQTETSVLDQFAIVLDGKVVSAPMVQGVINGGNGEISGGGSGFSENQATSLANVLKYGHLPLSFHAQNVDSISPSVGSAQLSAGLTAAAVGLLLVVIYSFFYYRGLGLVSVSSLAIAALLAYLSVVLLSKYEGFTLDLAGVAGLVVAIGITADSFVVYFERLRDEVREGRSLRAAVERGWSRARRTILVSDTVSFLAAALLYIFAIGDVKGFAYTLGLTTLIDVLVVFLFTKPMVTLLARTKFYGQGHKLSGLDPERLGARAPWRSSRRPAPRPATGGASATSGPKPRTSPKEA
jgi:preprotein translocase subunit SecD